MVGAREVQNPELGKEGEKVEGGRYGDYLCVCFYFSWKHKGFKKSLGIIYRISFQSQYTY